MIPAISSLADIHYEQSAKLLANSEMEIRRLILHNFFQRETFRQRNNKRLLQNAHGKRFLELLMDLELWDKYQARHALDEWNIDRFSLSVMVWIDELLVS